MAVPDLTKLSTPDLQALAAGDMSKVSIAGLRHISGSPEKDAGSSGGLSDLGSEVPKMGTPPRARPDKSTDPIAEIWSGAQDFSRNLGDAITDLPRQAIRAGSEAVTSAPLMAADVPVAASNLIRGRDKQGNYPAELPSAKYQRTLDKGFPAPTSTAGKASETVSSILMGGVGNAGRRTLGMLTPGERAAAALPKKVPNVSPSVRALTDKGVTLTPGDIKGGAWRSFEDKMSSLPIVGTMIKNAKGRSVAQFQEATINDALKEIGEKSPKGLSGHEAIRQAKEKFSAAYDAILPKMKGDLDSVAPPSLPATAGAGTSPTSFRGSLNQIKSMVANSSLDPKQQETINRILDKDILAKFTQHGKASGDTLQSIREVLRGHIEEYQNSTNPGDRTVGKAIEFAREAMDDMITRENPALSAQYTKLRNGYAQYKIAETAAGYKGASKEGIPTASQYMGAVRAADKSKNHSAFATGRARQQPLAKAGEEVLGGREPDSGTPGRLAAMDLAAGGKHLMRNPLLIAGMASVPFIYSQTGLRGLQTFLTSARKTGSGLGRNFAAGAAAAVPQATAPGSVDQLGVGH